MVIGARVRFHAWNAGNIGAAELTQFVPAGPDFLFDPAAPEAVSITLPMPFAATGKHFLSVQVHLLGGGYWDIWGSNVGSPSLSPAKVRNNLGSGQWALPTIAPWSTQTLVTDLSFRLFGTPATGGPQVQPCFSWSTLTAARPQGARSAMLRDLTVLALDDAWAVGYEQYGAFSSISDQNNLVMHWDGQAWTPVPCPSPGPLPAQSQCDLRAIAANSATDLWAGGTYLTTVAGGWGQAQHVLAMHWDGSAWTVPANLPLLTSTLPGGLTATVNGIAALAPNDVWFAGIANASGLLMHWDGVGFTTTTLPIVTGLNHQWLYDIAASTPTDVWVSGGAGFSGNWPGTTVPVLFRRVNGAFVHTPCPTPNPGHWIDLYEIAALAPNDVTVFGTTLAPSGAGSMTSFMAHWNGSGWTLLPGPPIGAIKVFAANDIYAAGHTISHWDGTAWTTQHTLSDGLSAALHSIDGLSPCQLFGVGGQNQLGQPAPFAARQDANIFSRTSERMAAVPASAPGRLRATSLPRIGSTLRVTLDDPSGALATSAALTLLVLATAPAPSFPAPVTIPFGGRGGGPGALFLDPSTIGYWSPLVPWSPGQPALHTVAVPNNPSIVGFDAFAQGLLIDSNPPGDLVVSNALDVHLGW